MSKLSARQWVDAGLEVLEKEGPQSLKANIIAKRLNVSRGSFYWHFSSVGEYHQAVLKAWSENASSVFNDVDMKGRDPLRELISKLYNSDFKLEKAIRNWAQEEPKVAKVVADLDTRREVKLGHMIGETVRSPAMAHARAMIVYTSFLCYLSLTQQPTREKLYTYYHQLLSDARAV